jgi:hypothetical protein
MVRVRAGSAASDQHAPGPLPPFGRRTIAPQSVINTAVAARLIAIVMLVSACGAGSIKATAAPVVIQAPGGVNAFAPIAPAARIVPGVITFGTAYDPKTLEIAKPLTRFKRTFPEIAWSAQLSRGVDAPSMSWVVVRRSKAGVEKLVYNVEETVDGPSTLTVANAGDLALCVGNVAGTYVMRYVDAGEVLAEGTFTLVK